MKSHAKVRNAKMQKSPNEARALLVLRPIFSTNPTAIRRIHTSESEA